MIEFQFDARSRPSGENPTGTGGVHRRGRAVHPDRDDCLAGSGSTATAVGQLAFNSRCFTHAKFTVVDNGPAGNTYGAAAYRSVNPPPCTPITAFEGDFTSLPRPIVSGDIHVVDAQPFPTSNDQCKNGGWKTLGVVKNQGDCVSFVATKGENQPSFP